MKDGRTALAHKAEPAGALSSGALLAVRLPPASDGDTSTVDKTLAEAQSTARECQERGIEEVVADKGYHRGEVRKDLPEQRGWTYLSEPDRGACHGEGARRSSRTGRRRTGASEAIVANDGRECAASGRREALPTSTRRVAGGEFIGEAETTF
jgi:hypothetical protein